jgi:hypothetical protein
VDLKLVIVGGLPTTNMTVAVAAPDELVAVSV